MELGIIMLSEINQKDKGCMFSLICGKWIQKINVYTNINKRERTCCNSGTV
jgi:hypothetical protein